MCGGHSSSCATGSWIVAIRGQAPSREGGEEGKRERGGRERDREKRTDFWQRAGRGRGMKVLRTVGEKRDTTLDEKSGEEREGKRLNIIFIYEETDSDGGRN